ncbi:MAG: T9SS type A sorting domain-containing protein [Bacteroidota bacterium]
MKNLFILLAFFPSIVNSQTGWTWQELPPMPQAISNNAVCEAFANDTAYVYTFAGIDSTKIFSGINLQAMCYNTISEEWSVLPDLPDTLGKIGVGASFVNDKIYIIGGYHVFQNGSEISSNKVHIYDPVANTYLADGASIPVPIDDHVQAVWRDSLIYVVTGWSNNGNVNNVQIYNPFTDEWQVGTSTPNSNIYRAFGASGVIIGDTIFYNGGATGGQFNSTGRLRRGLINPVNPTEIEWSQLGENPGAKGYRMAAASYEDKAFWIGGSGITYNYNGIAYNGSGGVPPLNRILRYNSEPGNWFEGLGAPYGIMDLRGIARISQTEFIICGGMEANQKVTDRSFLLTFDPLNTLSEASGIEVHIFPNPATDVLYVQLENGRNEISLIDSEGKVILRKKNAKTNFELPLDGIVPGTYFFNVEGEKGSRTEKLIVQ